MIRVSVSNSLWTDQYQLESEQNWVTGLMCVCCDLLISEHEDLNSSVRRLVIIDPAAEYTEHLLQEINTV